MALRNSTRFISICYCIKTKIIIDDGSSRLLHFGSISSISYIISIRAATDLLTGI